MKLRVWTKFEKAAAIVAAAVTFGAVAGPVQATPFTMTSPTGTVLPTAYPEAGGVAMILYGANGNIYYQFSERTGAFVGFQNNGSPAAFRGNPFTINTPLTMDCGLQTCSDYFGGQITRMEVRFTAQDGDTQPGGFDENDISLLINGVNIGNWSGRPTQNTNQSGTTLISSGTGFGNGTFDTGWFATTNAGLLSNILTTETISTQVFDDDPNDNYWNFRLGGDISNPDLERVSPAYTLEKTARSGSFSGPEITSYAAVGDVVYYNYSLQNVGNVAIRNLEVEDDQLGTVACSPADIQPSEFSVCQASHTITQADLDAGSLTNVAVATGDPDFGQLGTLSDTVTLTGPTIDPELTVTKTPDGTTLGAAGSGVTYTIVIENSGNVTLSNVSASDPLIPGLSCTAASLAPGATRSCTGNYTITQADVDAGSLSNTVTVSAEDPSGGPLSESDTAVNSFAQSPAMSVTKATTSTPAAAGDTLDYTFELRNDGNVSISGVAVTDAKCAAAPALVSESVTANGILDVGETQSYSCTSVAVTQAEVDAGTVDNTVNVTGTPAGGTLAPASDTLSTPITAAPGFTLSKATVSVPTAAGDTLDYTFDVVNTGNVSISGVAVTDAKCAAAPVLSSESITANAILDVGETQVFTCTSVAVTQAEVDAGAVENSASVAGTPAGGSLTPATDTVSTPIVAAPLYTLSKATTSAPAAAGDTLDYTFTLTNTGNVSISGASVTDAKCASAITLASGDDDGDGILDVGEAHVFQCTSIPVTQAEVDAGSVDNTANANGTPAGGSLPPASDTLNTPVTAVPAITLDKRLAAASPTSYAAVGDVLLYEFEVTNSGNVTITDAVSITDPLLDAPATCPPVGAGIAPGASIACTGQITVDQTDIDNGSVPNTATAQTGGGLVSPGDGVTVAAVQTPELSVVKTATAPPSFAPGQVINYTYLVTNEGNVTIPATATISVSDNRTGVSCPAIPGGGIAPGGTLTCTASYTIVAADVSIGTVTNTASATDGTTTSPTVSETVPTNYSPALTLNKAATSPAPATYATVGDVITYTYTVQNTGGAAFDQPITVTDDKINGGTPFTCWAPSGGDPTFDPDPAYGTNAPPTNTNGETATCTATYAVTQADVDAGSVTNEAVADTVFAPSGPNIPVASDPVSETVSSTPDASMSVAKAVSPTVLPAAAPGDVLTYTVTVTNDGEVTLDDVGASDPGPSFNGNAATGSLSVFAVSSGTDANSDGLADSLAPGASASFTATYTLTQADIDNAAGAPDPLTAITNTATASATPRTGTLAPVTPAGATTGFAPAPSFAMVKQTTSVPMVAGDTLDYTFTIENTGNVSITGVAVTDAKCAAVPTLQSGDLDSDSALDVTEAWVFACTSVPVTQAEVDAGMVDNSASVSGTPSGGTLADASDSVSTPVAEDAGFTLAKATASTPAASGDTLEYTFTVANTGNVSIENVAVTDAKCGAAPTLQSGDDDSDSALDVTEIWVFACTSVPVTQAEVDAGTVDNSASLAGDAPSGAPVTPESDVVSTPIAAAPSLSVAKATTSSPAAAGDTLDYTFTVTNPGNVSIGNVIVTDAKCAASPALQSGDGNSNSRIEPTETWVFGCTSVPVTQAEIDAGSVDNSVSVSGNAPSGAPITPAADTLSTPVTAAPAWGLVKTATTSAAQAGDTLEYRFSATNSGNVSISAVSIADAKCAAAPVLVAASDTLSDGLLMPGETWDFTCSSIPVTQAEIDSGQVDNSATASGTPSAGSLPPAAASHSAPVASAPGLSMVKASSSTPAAAGDTLDYSFTVTNTGNTSLSSVAVTDAKCAAAPTLQSGDADSDGALDVTETWVLSCTSVPVTQAEVDAGEVLNSATVDAQDPGGNPAPSAGDSDRTPIAGAPGWTVTKANTTAPTATGDTIDYSFTVVNTGNVSVSNIVVTDAKCAATPVLASGDGNSDGALNPSETFTYSCTSIPVTQAEIDAGIVANSVTVTGDAPNGDPLPPASDSHTVAVLPDPGIDVQKSVVSGTPDVGAVVIYQIEVENTGNVTLSPVTLTDTLTRLDGTPLTPSSGPSFLSASAGSSAGSIVPGETAIYQLSYVLTQDDVDAGGIRNSAEASGTPPSGAPVSDVSDDDGNPANGGDTPTEFLIPAAPAMELAKSLIDVTPVGGGSAASFAEVGDQLNYSFTISNTGNVTLDGPFTVADPLIDGAGGSVTCPAGPVAPGGTLVCTGSYDATQADLDAGSVVNTATASDGTTSSPPASETTGAVQTPSLVTTKTADSIPPASFVVGGTVTYTYDTTNDGNVTVTDPITITDNRIAPADITCPAWPGALAPGATYTCTGVYTVTSDDVELGVVTNIATGSDGSVTSPQVSESVPDGAIPALGIEKTSTTTSFADVGDTLDYSFTVTNTGTRAFVQPVTVEDALIGTVTCWTPVSGDPDFIAGETATCSGTYTITQDDLDAGSVTNEAFARTTYGGGTEVVSDPDTATVNAAAAPSMSLAKSAALPGGKGTEDLVPGDVLTYTLAVENTGNQTLSNIGVSDPLLGLNCTIASLAPTLTDSSCSGTYTLTQADIDAGSVDNSASASGASPSGAPVTSSDAISTPMPTPAPSLALTKTATPSPFGAVGSTVTYTMAVENTGNVTLSGLTLSDPLLPSLSCSIASLAPGVTDSTCTGLYTVTQDDVDAGSLTNTATVAGTDPSGGPVSTSGAVTTPGPAAAPGLEATKTFDSTGTVAGSTVTFTVRVVNTGNVTLSSVSPADTLTRVDTTPLALNAPGLSLTGGDADSDGALDVDEIWVYTGTYTLTQADIDAGGIQNVAVVSAQDPSGTPVSDTADDGDDGDGNTTDDPTVFEILAGPQLVAEKTVSGSTGMAAGDTVSFAITARNTGNVTLRTVSFADTLSRADGTPLALTTAPTLQSGDSNSNNALDVGETWVYEATYVLTQDDVDAGGISNTVEVFAVETSGGTISDVADNGDDTDGNSSDDPAVFEITPAPGMESEKTVTTAATAVGEEMVWSITVVNTGNVTLTGVVATDTLTRADGTVLSLSDGPTFASASSGSPEGSLVPGETATYTARYTVVQEDIDAGGIANQVLAQATTPGGAGLTDLSDDPAAAVDTGPSDATVTTFTQTASMTLGKAVVSETVLFPTLYQVVFEITAVNDGNVTQSGIVLNDDLAAFAAPATIDSASVAANGFTGAGGSAGFDGVADTSLLDAPGTLAPGDTGTVTVTVVYSTETGFPSPGTNTVTGTSDQVPTPDPAEATITNVDSDGDGVPDNLESASADRDGDGIPDAQDYDPTGYFYCEEDGRLLSGAVITVSGGGFSQTGVGTSGPIVITRDGSAGFYQFHVTAAGTYTLSYSAPSEGSPSAAVTATTAPTDVTTLVDVLTGTTTTNPRVLGSGEAGGSGILADFSPAANPAFYTSFTFEAGDPFVFSNNIPFQACTTPGDLVATKTVIGRTDVRIGDLVTYQIDFALGAAGGALANIDLVDILPTGISYVPGTASIALDAAAPTALEPTISGNRLVWGGQSIPVGSTLSVVLSGRVMPNAPSGELVNRAFALDAAGNQISNTATAVVERVPEHVFDCSDVIGKVFDDLNQNGYQDQGEPGLKGVRVVTVRGTRITTDEYGRFHVPCAELPRDIGTNFILKVDERTLPSGYRLTTENPRVERLTAGKFAKMNFGASLSRVVRVNLNARAFGADGAPTAKLNRAFGNLVQKMPAEPSVIRLTYVLGKGEDVSAARARLKSVEKLVRAHWRKRGRYKLNVELTVKRR